MERLPEQMETEPERIGLRAQRGCTDCLFLLLFAGALGGYCVMATIAVENGNPYRLIYGTDYLGNVCGKTGSKNAPRQPLPDAEWEELDLLWYPFSSDNATMENAVNLGICVAECPHAGSVVHRYPDPANATHHIPTQFDVIYNSAPKLRRCLPDTNNTAAIGKVADLINLFDISGLIFEGIADIREADTTLYRSVGVAVGVSVVWLLLVYCFSLPMLFLSILAILGGFALSAKLLLDHANDLKASDNPDYKYVRIGAYAVAGVGGLFFFLCVCMIGKIIKGAKLAKEGSKMLLAIPSVLVVPIVFVVLIVFWVFVAVVCLLFIQTMERRTITEFSWAGATVEGLVQEVPVNKYYFHAYNLVFFTWCAVFLLDTAYLSVAMVAGFWYFSGGKKKQAPLCAPVIAMGKTVLHHLGTTAFGALVITICKLIRWFLMRLESRMKAVSGDGLKCCFKIAECCLCYLEKCLKVLSEKAYVVTAIEGSSFCSSAVRAIKLIVANFTDVAVVEVITSFMVFVGKLLVVGATVVFAYYTIDIDDYWVPLIVIACAAYIISCVFVHVFGTVVDALMLCHCIDKDLNNASPKYGTAETRHIADSCKVNRYESTD